MKLPRRPGSSADSTKIQELHLASQAGVFIQQREAENVSFGDGFSSSCGLRAGMFSSWTASIPDFAISGSPTSFRDFVWILEVTSLRILCTVMGEDEPFKQG